MNTTVNEITIKYKHRKILGDKITSSKDAHLVARKIYKQSDSNISLKEYFFIILLNRANKVIGYHKLSEGGITGTVADVRLTFAAALKSLSSGMILIHNHPSGNLKPSKADLRLTSQFKGAGEIMDIPILDHLILTEERCYSMADEGIL